jgi:hypothetical protein
MELLLRRDQIKCGMKFITQGVPGGKVIFWEVTVSVVVSKNYIRTSVLFRTVSEIKLFHCTYLLTELSPSREAAIVQLLKNFPAF